MSSAAASGASKSAGLSTKTLAMIGVMTAITCILGPLSLPIGPVPISLTHLSVFLAVYALGAKNGTISFLMYLLIGLLGLPVFSGGAGGPAKLFGPTGGYLIGFIFMALAAGLVIDRTEKRYLHAIAMIAGIAICYLFGTIWFVRVYTGADGAKMSFGAALSICVYPFLIGDAVKMILCLIVGPVVKTQLRKAGLRQS